MPITFTRAVPVEEGTRPTSTQLKTLARAFKDRLRNFSFCSWRLIWYHFNLFRQMRNPSASGFVFPPQGEYFHIYQHLDPEYHQGATWPETGPGEPEGANVANPMNQFVFGIEDPQGGPGVDAEDARLNLGLPFVLTPTPTTEQLWELGKAQRGAYDQVTGAQNTPAWDVAQSHFRITQPYWSPHGKALGGWLPTPVQLLSSCGTTEATGLYSPSYQIKFTGLRSGLDTSGYHGTPAGDPPVVTYAGSCPCGSDSWAAGHVLGIAYGPLAYHVYVADGTGNPVDGCGYDVDVFPIADWIEGPYTGAGRLGHTVGNQLERALWAFHSDFRGTPAQRTPDTFKIRRIAFDNQEFWTRQYALAPALGRVSGDSVEAVYPRSAWTPSGGVVPLGTFGTFGQGAEFHYLPGFVLAGIFGRATGLLDRISLGFYSQAQLLATLDLTPDSAGNASAMFWLKTASKPEPLKVKLLTDARFKTGGTLVCEATEQMEYKPQYWDGMLVTRFGASQGGDQFGGGVDGRGRDTANSKDIGDGYFANGCVNTYQGVRSIAEWINDNPVYDSIRRLSRDHARVTRRQQLVSYEVAGGKSILRFKRFPQYPGIDGRELRADCFADIAPPLDAVALDGLTEGETYIVRGSGQIVYRGASYSQNQTFTATTVKEFQTHGTASLYVKDGIRHAALKKGFTNEWTMFVEPRCYHPSDSSVWKRNSYTDYFSWCDRCHFYNTSAPSQIKRFSGGGDLMLAPEMPDSFRYAAGSNLSSSNANFFKSCQVYNPPYEIESCTVDDWSADQIIKITLTTRLRSHPNAAATVAADPNSWSAGDIASLRNSGGTPEAYRTDDNAVREYVLSEANGNYSCVFRTGDAGMNSGVSGLPDNPFGSCYPMFFFSRLIPEPYDDGNDTLELHDSRCLIDMMLHMEVALRSMCEGFIDGRTSREIICDTGLGNLYDYTFENLCFEAFGGRWIGAFALSARSDGPSGFGPLPNTKMYAEVFNRLVSAVNLLDKMRLDLPIRVMARTLTYVEPRDVTLTELSGSCTGTGAAYGDNMPPLIASVLTATGAWAPVTVVSASKGTSLTGCPYALLGTRVDTEYRVEINTAAYPDLLDAVPAAVQALINNSDTGFLANRETFRQSERRESVSIALADRCPSGGPGGPFWTAGAEQYRWTLTTPFDVFDCVLVKSSTLTAEPPEACDQKIGTIGGVVTCTGATTSSVSLNLIAEQNAFLQVPLV